MEDLVNNANGEAEYFEYHQTAVSVCEKKSMRGDELTQVAIEKGWMTDNETNGHVTSERM